MILPSLRAELADMESMTARGVALVGHAERVKLLRLAIAAIEQRDEYFCYHLGSESSDKSTIERADAALEAIWRE